MVIITAVGRDRPGMAHAVAEVLTDAQCNIEDTTMTRLCGEFAMILIASLPAGLRCDQLATRLAPLEQSHGLFITCRAFTDEPGSAGPHEGAATRYMLSLYGPEKSGLVARITGVLAGHNVNITDVQTRVASGGTVYVMIFELEVPPALDIAVLSAALESAAQEANLQISLRPLEEETL